MIVAILIGAVLVILLAILCVNNEKLHKKLKNAKRTLEFKQEELDRVRDSLVQEEIKCNNYTARDAKARRIVGAYLKAHHEKMRKIELLHQELCESDHTTTILNLEISNLKARLDKIKKASKRKPVKKVKSVRK